MGATNIASASDLNAMSTEKLVCHCHTLGCTSKEIELIMGQLKQEVFSFLCSLHDSKVRCDAIQCSLRQIQGILQKHGRSQRSVERTSIGNVQLAIEVSYCIV